ncbi:MAG: DUF983 domain-containing protein [Bacteroidota bacterium]
MPHSCEVCGQRMEPEPGFYFGAMFISYVLSSFFLLAPTLLLVFYFKWSVTAAITFTIFLGAITYVRFLRLSRAIWLHLNVPYEGDSTVDAA